MSAWHRSPILAFDLVPREVGKHDDVQREWPYRPATTRKAIAS